MLILDCCRRNVFCFTPREWVVVRYGMIVHGSIEKVVMSLERRIPLQNDSTAAIPFLNWKRD